jgi:conjugative transposon TraM protein
MQSVVKSQAFLRKRKMMLVLPLLVIPFVTLAFYALGGGQAHADGLNKEAVKGLNLKLPDVASKEDQLMDKLGFYEKAQKDSMQLAEWMLSDPYYKQTSFASDTLPNELAQIHQSVASKYNERLNVLPYEKPTEAPEEKIMQKISLLQKEMSRHAVSANQEVTLDGEQPDASGQVDRLKELMQQMNKTDEEGDPGIKQLDSTLDKILDIQHPERVKDRLKEKSLEKETEVFAVNEAENKTPVSILGSNRKNQNITATPKRNGFFGTHSDMMKGDEINATSAVIHETQTVTAGSTVKLRLLTDIYVNGNLIPKGSFVFGTASLENERLLINIPGIRHGNNLLPVSLAVYDMDGLVGIHIPGSISRDVAKQSADQSLQGIELMSLDPSLKAQAATAGIQAAKGLLSKKIKLVKVTLKAGYRVLLKDGNKQEN